ncbi:MAG: sodium:calcium antiporter [Pyrinomonadaceae bacterium]
MDFNNLSLLVLIGLFAASALVIWFAGIKLAGEVDRIDNHFGLGEALGGLILLAVITNLPEIAITVSAALQNNLEIAVGNILGGIAIQTVVLVFLDFYGIGKKTTLTSLVKSPVILIEAIMVVFVLALVVIGRVLPASLAVKGISPVGVLIPIAWIAGLYLVKQVDRDTKKSGDDAQSDKPDKKDDAENDGKSGDKKPDDAKQKISKTLLFAAIFAVLTLVAGFVIEFASDALAKKIGIDGVLFSATVLAAATSLPEVSTGLASINLKDYELAVSDIFGGNAFLPTLFLVAEVLSRQVVFDKTKNSDIYLLALGILLTLIYLIGFVVQSKKQIGRVGFDSLAVLILYLAALCGLFFVQ